MVASIKHIWDSTRLCRIIRKIKFLILCCFEYICMLVKLSIKPVMGSGVINSRVEDFFFFGILPCKHNWLKWLRSKGKLARPSKLSYMAMFISLYTKAGKKSLGPAADGDYRTFGVRWQRLQGCRRGYNRKDHRAHRVRVLKHEGNFSPVAPASEAEWVSLRVINRGFLHAPFTLPSPEGKERRGSTGHSVQHPHARCIASQRIWQVLYRFSLKEGEGGFDWSCH